MENQEKTSIQQPKVYPFFQESKATFNKFIMFQSLKNSKVENSTASEQTLQLIDV
jgi:hypothetical protein